MFSLLVLIQSSLNCTTDNPYFANYSCTDINAFAPAAGAVSLALCLSFFVAEIMKPINPGGHIFISVFFFLWWLSTAIVLTFFGPFTRVIYPNGYFGTWGAFFISMLMLSDSSASVRRGLKKFSSGVSNTPLFYLLISSCVCIGASIDTCIPTSACTGYNAFAVALGTVSAFIVIILIPIHNHIPPQGVRGVAMILALWWTIGGMIVTFKEPFNKLGNGYFGTLASIVFSFLVLQTNPKNPETHGKDHDQPKEIKEEAAHHPKRGCCSC